MNIDKETTLQEQKEEVEGTKKEPCLKYDIVDESDDEEFIKNLLIDKNMKKKQ